MKSEHPYTACTFSVVAGALFIIAVIYLAGGWHKLMIVFVAVAIAVFAIIMMVAIAALLATVINFVMWILFPNAVVKVVTND